VANRRDDQRPVQLNLRCHPKAEESLWRPDLQEIKRSQTGGINERPQLPDHLGHLGGLVAHVAEHLPCCRIRYAF
jgi:spore photoproduct lyase